MPAFGAATDYHHSLFVARIRHPEKLRSERPLAWVTEEEIHHGWTAGSAGVPGAPSGFAARISPTAREVLGHLGLIAEAEAFGPDVDQLAEEWLAGRETRQS